MSFSHRSKLIAVGLIAVFAAICGGEAAAQNRQPNPAGVAAEIDFDKHVRPIFAERCYRCHGPDQRKGGLRLATRRDAFTAADSGDVVIVPGESGKSVLIERVTSTEEGVRMPPEGARLTEEQIALLRRWIDQGARWPEETHSRHWAYIKPVRPERPAVHNAAWPRNEIDYFVLSRLEKEGMRPSSEAERRTLVRRVYLDLIGLPPTPAELEAFEQAARRHPDSAFENLVDQLLARPQFGERWARPWLDLARYADSNGFQRDGFRDLWAYRDWVIKALNSDMPFDQFTIEQIAGDLLPNATLDQQIATGFHRCTTVNVEAGTDQEENRVNQVIDRVNTTGTVWLGTTIECAQCHNHKYDPFTQRDYYQLFAFFNNTEIETAFRTAKATAAIDFVGPMIDLPDPEVEGQRRSLEEQLARLDRQIAEQSNTAADAGEAWEAELLASGTRGPTWHVLDVAEFHSAGGATGTVLEDRSVLVGGELPEKDTYTVAVRTQLAGITGFKVEALTDPSLPGEGPGRGDEERPNFILSEFTVALVVPPSGGEQPRKPTSDPPPEGGTTNGKPQPVKLHSPQADFSQKNWDVAGAIDGDPKTGWAINPQFHKPHEASFLTEKPIDTPTGGTLVFRLVQNYGGARTIGRLRLSAFTGDRDAEPPPADIVAILKKPREKRNARETKKVDEFRAAQNPAIKPLRARRDAIAKQLKDLDLPRTLVMKEMPQPRMTSIFRRGDFLQPGERVAPGVPAVLHPLATHHSPIDHSPTHHSTASPTRLDLARWLVDRENPLVARVTVNRWWAEIFGHGLVSTPEDFGIKGEPPTHPELLDWLAVEFMDRGWSMKHVLRTIVTSATYRQSAKVTPELLARDDQNKLYARGPRVRLDAETVRDNALSIAGLLSLKQGGPPVKPYQPEGLWNVTGLVDNTYKVSEGDDRYRRGLYTVWRRSAPYPSFMNFDAQIRAACVVKRSRSNTPLQALTLLNDPVYVEAAKALAERIVNEVPSGGLDERLRHAFVLCLARAPSESEVNALAKLHVAALARYRDDAKAAKALLAGFDLPPNLDPAEFAAWHETATVLLNLDETITK